MRFALRNQQKIVKSFGVDYLNLLLASLEKHFRDNETIKEETIQGWDYKVIYVYSVAPNSEIDFQFFVVSKRYDVYLLAYYSSIG
jgi:hypothetical protein